jgi:glycosyltransferase involved in cell wall biosynthesis
MILILLPIWKREKITDICLSNLKRLQEKENFQVLCVVSEQWAKIKAFEYGFKFIESENFPVGGKMNNGIKEALRFDWDYLMNLGSDDIIDERLFKLYKPFIEQKRECFGVTKCTFIDSETKEVKRFDYKHLIGAGRMIRRDIVERYFPLYPLKNKCLDDGSARNMFGTQFTEIQETEDDLIVDIKSDQNIWSFDFFEGENSKFETLNINDETLTKLIEL